MMNLDEYKKIKFETYGFLPENPKNSAVKVPDGVPIPTHDSETLRKKILEIIWAKTDEYMEKNNTKISYYDFIERNCRIPSETLKKALNGKYNITRKFLYKFTVGLKLDIEAANELFYNHSGYLSTSNNCDFIIYHAFRTKDNIDEFIEEFENITGICLDKDKN